MRRSLAVLVVCTATLPALAAEPPKVEKTFAAGNLVAWCIVPFDAKKRGPEERVVMLQRLGFKKYAYDWRAEHLPTFDTEATLLKKAGIELSGVWFPADLGKDAQTILGVLKKHEFKTDLWVMLPQPDAKLSQQDKVKAAAAVVTPLAQAAGKQGCRVGIYNHGGWTGEPVNMLAVAAACGEKNVGVVYNLHHAHDRLAEFADDLKALQPHLYCLNVNGMEAKGETNGHKILCVGDGEDDEGWLKVIREKKYAGPIGILGHTDDDAEDRLADNLNGLECLVRGGFLPAYRTRSENRPIVRLERPTPEAPFAFTFKQKFKQFKPDDFRVYVSKPGLDPAWYSYPTKVTPVAGATTTVGDTFVFTPRFPPEPGTTYRIFAKCLTASFTVPNPKPETPAEVLDISPTTGVLPENTLRMYLHFSRPMKTGDVYKFITLQRADGAPVLHPFLEIGEELWSRDGTRLTLLFDPGRVKRGLKPREEDGPILEEGKKYTLTISKDWPDEGGFPLKVDVKKTFTAVKPDEAAVTPAKWTIAATRDAVVVTFEKPLDRALAERLVWVVGPDGKRVKAKVAAAKDATRVTLTPAVALAAGNYKLVVDTRLEDVCGNRVNEPFEVDVLKAVTEKLVAKTVELPFEVK